MRKYVVILIISIYIVFSFSRIVIKQSDINEENIFYIEEKSAIKSEFDKEDAVKIVCEKIKSIDFTIKLLPLDISPEVDRMYRKAYLDILKNKIAAVNYEGEKEYFIDLYNIGIDFEELKSLDYYLFYYNDLDGDGLPELGIKNAGGGGYTYIFKYLPEINEFQVLYSNASMYITILGTGQIWYHDGLHANLLRDRYIVLDNNNKWKIVFNSEHGLGPSGFYSIEIDDLKVNVTEKTWNEITRPFFDATKNAIPSMNFEEIFNSL